MTPSGAGRATPGGDDRLSIVCAYPEGRLANAWFRAYRRARRALRTRGFDARVALHPITDLPTRVDVLVVPPSLAAAVPPGDPVRETVVASPEGLQHEIDRLVERLAGEGRIQYATPQPRTTAVHVGFEPVTERARSSD